MLFILVIGITVLLGLWYNSTVQHIQKLEKERKYVELANSMPGMSLLTGCNWAWFVIVIFLSLSHTWWLFGAYIATTAIVTFKVLARAMEPRVELEVCDDHLESKHLDTRGSDTHGA